MLDGQNPLEFDVLLALFRGAMDSTSELPKNIMNSKLLFCGGRRGEGMRSKKVPKRSRSRKRRSTLTSDN